MLFISCHWLAFKIQHSCSERETEARMGDLMLSVLEHLKEEEIRFETEAMGEKGFQGILLAALNNL